jgi:hypothetical protein
MTTTSNAINEQSSIFLNLEQMAAAVEYLVTCWPGKQMLPDERESWLDVLCMVHPGELKPALARIGTRYRPDPYALLEATQCAQGPRRRSGGHIPPDIKCRRCDAPSRGEVQGSTPAGEDVMPTFRIDRVNDYECLNPGENTARLLAIRDRLGL